MTKDQKALDEALWKSLTDAQRDELKKIIRGEHVDGIEIDLDRMGDPDYVKSLSERIRTRTPRSS